MSYYSRNHLQDDWESEAAEDYAERLAAAEEEAGRFFDICTVGQKAIYDRAITDLRGLAGPRYDRARAEAKRVWYATTAEAAALLDQTVECIMAHGEVSEELEGAWDALRASQAMHSEAA